MKSYSKYLILIIPVVYLIWSIQTYLMGGPFSLSRSDPEYPYLLNGLSCAIFHFHNIGLISHPGTPFEILTGLFLRITHLMIGQGPIVDDVLQRPEMYLATSALYLAILTSLLLYWAGRVATRNMGKISGAIILQSTFFLSTVLVDLSLRYSADRILAIYALILAGLTVKYLFTENYPEKKYAILAGILMGVGLATKFNFLPVLFIPLLLIPEFRTKLIYAGSVAVACFVSLIPVLNKLKEFRSFITDIASHDGLYGQGSQKMINWKAFGHNFIELLSYNPAFTIILLAALGLIIWYIFDKKKFSASHLQIQLLRAFVYASVVGFILVSKHFKVYYFVPVLSLSALVLYIIWKISGGLMKSERNHTRATAGVLVILLAITIIPLVKQYQSRLSQKKANLKTQEFYTQNVTKKDWLFIEPTWMAGPMVENALAYGISYVAHRQEFYRDFNRYYPNVITWEGAEVTPKFFRTADADPESLVLGGRDIFVYSSPGRNPGALLGYLQSIAGKFGTSIAQDTVFKNPLNEDRVIRVRNNDRWTTLKNITDITEATELQPGGPVSQQIFLTGVNAGDYIEITVRILHNDNDARVRIIARSVQSDQDGIYFEDSGSLQDIGNGWQLLRLRGRIITAPVNEEMVCQVYYPGTKKTTVQNLQINHMGRR